MNFLDTWCLVEVPIQGISSTYSLMTASSSVDCCFWMSRDSMLVIVLNIEILAAIYSMSCHISRAEIDTSIFGVIPIVLRVISLHCVIPVVILSFHMLIVMPHIL